MKHSILDRTRFISLVLTIMIVLSIVAVPVSAGTQLTVTFDIKHDQVEARKMLDMINNIRLNDAWLWKSEDGDEKIQITGLSKLTYDYTLEKIAIQRAEELGKHYECGVRPDGSDFSKLEINDVNSFCECICSNVQSVNAAFAEFEEKNEPNHWQDNREALLSRDYSAIAIAHVKFGAKDFWVLEFGKTNSGAAKTTARTDTTKETMTFDSSDITFKTRINDGEKISLKVGENQDIPSFELYIVYGKKNSISIPGSECSCSWSSGDTDYLKVEGGKLIPLKVKANAKLIVNGTYQGVSFKGSTYVTVNQGSGSSGSSGSSTPAPATGTPTPGSSSGSGSSSGGSSSGGSSSGSSSTPKPATPTVVVTQDDPSADAITNFVRRVYRSVLGREGEEEGVNYWINALYNYQVSGADLAMQFVTSKEYKDKGTSNDEFVEMLYSAFFGRASDTDGKNYWLSQLSAGVSREEVANGFVNSKEWANTCAEYGIRSGGTQKPTVNINPTEDTYAFVERMYTKAFKRSSDSGGLEYWAGLLANYTTTGEAVALEFFMSPEMESYNLSDEEFLERLYLTFMDRESEADGRAFWLNEMKTMSRREVVQCFAKSEEFRLKCIKARILPC